jgi:lipopolysaccharide export system permease protein
MKLLDRWLLHSFLKAWLVCFSSLLSLYVVIDLFSKLDEFLEVAQGNWLVLLTNAGIYYSYQVVLIFDRLNGVIMLMAAMFTVTWMQRHNELTPLLTSGIRLHRVLRPIWLGALFMLTLGVLNRELLMPIVVEKLYNSGVDPQQSQVKSVAGAYEPNGILVEGRYAIQSERKVGGFSCTVPVRIAGSLLHLQAAEAIYIPPGHGPHSGGWLLLNTRPRELPLWPDSPLTTIDSGKIFLRTEVADFDRLTRHRNWSQSASTAQLYGELAREGTTHLSLIAVQWHLRFTSPLLALLLVGMGLALLLRDQNRHIYVNAGLSLALAGLLYACFYLSRFLGDSAFLSPTLAAWMPLLIFGPIALWLQSGMRT